MSVNRSQKRSARVVSSKRQDSEFGKSVKKYLTEFGFTQADLAEKSLVRLDILNRMKGERLTGGSARYRVRSIIRGLYELGALHTLEEANDLLHKIPAVSSLDERNVEDLRLIELLKSKLSSSEEQSVQNPQPNLSSSAIPASPNPATFSIDTPQHEIFQGSPVQPTISPAQLTTDKPALKSKNPLLIGLGIVLVLGVLVIGFILFSGWFETKSPINGKVSPSPTTGLIGGFRVVDKLKLSSNNPKVGEVVVATFTVRNLNSFPITIPAITAGGRLLQIGTCQSDQAWQNDSDASFEEVSNLTLQGGEEYTYTKSNQFSIPGDYFVEPVQLGNNGWGGILLNEPSSSSYTRQCFTVKSK